MAERVDIEELERLAKAATSGPWHIAPCKPNCLGSATCTCVRSPDGTPVGEKYRSPRGGADREFIAAANPTAILALLSEVKAHRAALLAIHGQASRACRVPVEAAARMPEIERLSRG